MKNEKPISEKTRNHIREMWVKVGKENEAEVLAQIKTSQADANLIEHYKLIAEKAGVGVDEALLSTPPKTMTLDQLLTKLHDLKAKTFKGNGNVPVRIHIEEQDEIHGIHSVDKDCNSEDEEILIFTNTH